MKLAISVWNDRISPVFDTALHLLVVDLDNDHEVSRSIEPIEQSSLPLRTAKLTERIKRLSLGLILRKKFLKGNIPISMKLWIYTGKQRRICQA